MRKVRVKINIYEKIGNNTKSSRKRVIPKADFIESVRINDWWVIVKKDEFKVDDLVLYYEIDSFLPVKPEYEFLLRGSKPKKMLVDGVEVEGIRLKTVKLKDTISQGLVMPISLLGAGIEGMVEGLDVSDLLGVIKYEMPIPAYLSGKVRGSFPSFIPKTDEERIQNMGGVLSGFYVTEKLDGSSITFYKFDGVFGVCSRDLELEESDVTQWRLAKELNLPDKLPDNMALQGELVGEGIQKNPLKLSGQKVFFFNAYNIKSGVFLDFIDFVQLCEALNLDVVPVIDDSFTLPRTVDDMLEYADGKSMLNPEVDREGVVVRSKVEAGYRGGRLSFKAISNKYLLDYDA